MKLCRGVVHWDRLEVDGALVIILIRGSVARRYRG